MRGNGHPVGTECIKKSHLGERRYNFDSTPASTSRVSPNSVQAANTSVSNTINFSQILETSIEPDKFDSTLGVLNAILIAVRSGADSNTGSASVTWRDKGILNKVCDSSSGAQPSSQSASLDIPFDSGGPFSNPRILKIDSSEFDNFIGSGSFYIPWEIKFSHRISAGCNPKFLTEIDVCAVERERFFFFNDFVSVTYTYKAPSPPPSQEPLPASGLLLIGGLAALELRRRKG